MITFHNLQSCSHSKLKKWYFDFFPTLSVEVGKWLRVYFEGHNETFHLHQVPMITFHKHLSYRHSKLQNYCFWFFQVFRCGRGGLGGLATYFEVPKCVQTVSRWKRLKIKKFNFFGFFEFLEFFLCGKIVRSTIVQYIIIFCQVALYIPI